MLFVRLIIFLFLIFSVSFMGVFIKAVAYEEDSRLIKGYISNKAYKPIKLKIFEIDKSLFNLLDRDLDDNTVTPFVDLKIVAETPEDYALNINEKSIFIPKSTKLIGLVSEITPAKSFNRNGLVKVTFDKAICPGGDVIELHSGFISRSVMKKYSPMNHVGKATLSLLGGSLIGTLLSYQLGGLGLIAATNGYSLAGGAAAGGFIGLLGGVASKGKNPAIQPGSELKIIPADDIGLEELTQLKCKKSNAIATIQDTKVPDGIEVKILSFGEKKDWSGEKLFKIKISFKNNTKISYKADNFVLRDSQGKEYFHTLTNFNDDIFNSFPPNETRIAALNFCIEYPKANHWLVLKNQAFTEELGVWKIKG